jgi:hypothetical protein
VTGFVHEPGLASTLLARCLLAEYVRQQRNRLDIDASPALVRHSHHCDAVGSYFLAGGGIDAARCHDQARSGRDSWKRVIATRDPTRHLQIDQSITHAVSPQGFPQDYAQRGARHRPRDRQRGK